MADNSFKQNLNIPTLKLFVLYLIFGAIVWAFGGKLIFLLIFSPLYVLVGIFYLIIKAGQKTIIGEDFFEIEQNLLFTKKIKRFAFIDIDSFDAEKGIMLKLKKGGTFNMDNSSAAPYLLKNLNTFGIPQRTITSHDRPYMKK